MIYYLETLFDNCHLEMKAFKESANSKLKAYIDFHIYLDGHKYENWHIPYQEVKKIELV